MTAAELLVEMDSRGVSLSAADDRLLLRPRSALTPRLVAELRAQKAELLVLLRSCSSAAESTALSVSGSAVGPMAVAAMLLTEFACAGLIAQVHVSSWGRDVLLVSDDVPVSEINGRPQVVYRAHELKKLARIPPDPRHLRNVQMVAEILGGSIRDVSRTGMENRAKQEQREELKNGTAG